MEENTSLKEKVELAPRKPGVYLRKDAAGKIGVYDAMLPSFFLKKMCYNDIQDIWKKPCLIAF
jgi:hypothetical protein